MWHEDAPTTVSLCVIPKEFIWKIDSKARNSKCNDHI